MLLDLLNNVLDFSKFEAGSLKLELIDFDPGQVIEDVVNLMRSLAMAKTLDLTFAAGSEMPVKIQGDPLRFRQILANLISNAIKFTNDGSVTIRGESLGRDDGAEMLLIEIEDTGIGIAVEDQGHIFEAFSQADSSVTRSYGGSGLGLTICNQLVRTMGGEIGVKSVVGKGSIFWFTVPLMGKGGVEVKTGAVVTG